MAKRSSKSKSKQPAKPAKNAPAAPKLVDPKPAGKPATAAPTSKAKRTASAKTSRRPKTAPVVEKSAPAVETPSVKKSVSPPWNTFRENVAQLRESLRVDGEFPVEHRELAELLETLAAAYSLLASRETLAPELAKAVVAQLSQQRTRLGGVRDGMPAHGKNPLDEMFSDEGTIGTDRGAAGRDEGAIGTVTARNGAHKDDSPDEQDADQDGHDAEPPHLGREPLLASLRDVELPLALVAANVESIDGASPVDVRFAAGNIWHELIYRYLDGEGMLHGRWLPQIRALLSSWARCDLLAKSHGGSLLGKEDRRQCEQLLMNALAWSRDDGQPRLANDSSATSSPTGWHWATLAKEVFGTDTPTGKAAGKSVSARPEPTRYSEWSKAAILSTTRGATTSASFSICFAASGHRLELVVDGRAWLLGTPETTLSFDGQAVVLDHHWDEVCWNEDEDAVYLELEHSLGSHGRLQRQMLLARKDRFFLISDAILANKSSEISYATRWPVAQHARPKAAEKTRELFLHAKPDQCSVLPLSEPEWRSEPAAGELSPSDGHITFSRKANGHALYAPLWIDFDSARSNRPLTWRRLTIAESMAVVPADKAAGYRVQTGDDQFLIYRSLGPRGNRTLLGKNLVSEYLVARFARTGATESILEIE